MDARRLGVFIRTHTRASIPLRDRKPNHVEEYWPVWYIKQLIEKDEKTK